MNQTESKQLKLIEVFIPDIQAFIDKHIVGKNTMTAIMIAEAFMNGSKCDISSDDFVKAFRLAVRECLITSIEAAGRHGYKHSTTVRAPKVAAIDPALEAFVPYVDKVQAFVDRNIRGDKRMTAAVIYQKFLSENGTCIMGEDDFIRAFRQAIGEGKITGLESAKRFGYKRSGDDPDIEDADEVEEPEIAEESSDESFTRGCEIVVDESHRVVALDDKNWGYQVRHGKTWQNIAYFSNSGEMVRGIARKVIDNNIKGSVESIDFSQLEQRICEAETRIAELIKSAMVERDWGKICSKLHLPSNSRSEDVLAAIQSLIDADKAGLGFEVAMSTLRADPSESKTQDD